MAETFGILFLCVAGIVCIVIPCLAWLGFMVWVLTEGPK